MIREVFESAVVMGRRVLKTLGVDDDKITRIECAYRARDKERLRIQVEKGNDSPEARTILSPTALLLDDDG